jgi:hypothetical protein
VWFGAPADDGELVWSMPVQQWWALRAAFARGERLDPSAGLGATRAQVTSSVDGVHVELGGGFRRLIPAEAPIVDDVDQTLHLWPAALEVTVTVSDDLTERLAGELQQRGWVVDTSEPEPTTVSVGWQQPDDSEEGSLARTLKVHHDMPGGRASHEFGTDAQAVLNYLRIVPNLQIVKVTPDLDSPAIAELTQSLTLAGVPWRRDRWNEDGQLTGEMATSNGLGLELTVLGYGWMRARFELADRCTQGWVSYMRDSWADLLDATLHLTNDGSAAFCALLEEPDCKHVILTRDGDRAAIEVRHLPGEDEGNPTQPYGGVSLGSWNGAFTDLVQTIVAASRSLIAVAGHDGIEDRWTNLPPVSQLDELDRWLSMHRL